MEGDLLRLGRPPTFEGSEEAGQEWACQARAFLSLLGDTVADDLIREVMLENAPSHIRAQLALQGHTTSEALEMTIMSYLGVQSFLQQSGGGRNFDDGGGRRNA